MAVLSYAIELEEAVLVTGLEGDPNSSVSLPYLPGSVLRGALIGVYLRQKAKSELDAKDETERNLFLNGTTHFLNGYLEGSLPVPLSWHRPKRPTKPQNKRPCEKGDPQTVWLEDFVVDDEQRDEKIQLKSVRDQFCVVSRGKPAFVQPERQMRIQTARNRDYGRAKGGSAPEEVLRGQVYRYESLQRDQRFVAHIVCRDEDGEQLQALLNVNATIGGSRSSDYGCVKLRLIGRSDDPNWSEAQAHPFERDYNAEEASNTRTVVTLLSDLLLRDEHGQLTTDPTALAQELGVSQSPALLFVDYRPIGGFNRKWGLPLPQAMVFKMGSVFVFDGLSVEEVAHLQTLRGIGEQQVDGFGRIAVNWHTQSGIETTTLKSSDEDTVEMTEEALAVARTMVNRRHQARVRQQMVARVNEALAQQRVKSVSKSQLYRLRLQLQAIINGDQSMKAAQDELTATFADLRKRRSTQRQFSRAKLNNQPLLNWLEAAVTSSTRAFQVEDSHSLGEAGVTESAEMIFESNLRYVDMVLAQLIKLKQEGA